MGKQDYINHGWEFRLASSHEIELDSSIGISKDKWLPAVVPGTVHLDLLTNEIIPDPFYSNNESRLRWIDECDWEYRTSFSAVAGKYDKLVFEGIDTVADIYLNDSLILTANNMFVGYVIDISGRLLNGTNTLRILLKSAKRYAIGLEGKYGKLPVELESHRVYIRKAQYSFGWDWGPAFPTAGIWKSVYLDKTPDCSFSNVKFITEKIENNKANLKVSYDLIGEVNVVENVYIKLEKGHFIHEEKVNGVFNQDNILFFHIEDPELWYPNGCGPQNLYKLTLLATDKNGGQVDEVYRDVGIRTIELKLEINGKPSFKFYVNDKPVYMKGVNWIPADSFLPRITAEKYETLLSLAKDAHINMVRVWGGGIYEMDIFYDTCDKLGIMVWQDFMFACASYPEYEPFIENVKTEVIFQVSRLINHPSLAIWCGNNENEWIWVSKYNSKVQDMPGYRIFHEIIPGLLEKADPSRPYWPSSPFGYDNDPNDFNSGNTHQWEIWSHWVDYTEVAKDRSLFVTEFGFQGPANIDTLNSVIPHNERVIDSEIFKFHNKQVEGPERLNFFLEKHLPQTEQWGDYFYLTQLNQGFALDACLRHWRTNGITGGSLIWQLNDCWPVASWAIVDSELNPKLSYYFVKNIFEPCIICYSVNNGFVDVRIQNKSELTFQGKVEIIIVETDLGNKQVKLVEEISIDANSEFVPVSLSGITCNDKSIIVGRLYNDDLNLTHTSYYKHNCWKNYKLAQPDIEIELFDKGSSKQIKLRSDRPAFFVDLFCTGFRFSDRGFSIMPDEEVYISFLNKSYDESDKYNIRIFSLNEYLK